VAFLVQGAHSDTVRVPTSKCVAVPDAVSDDDAAAVLLQGLTAHYLATDCHHRPSSFSTAGSAQATRAPAALVHSAAGGTGSLLVQMLKIRGYTVIGTS
jgi:NADPH2:quinone reductase